MAAMRKTDAEWKDLQAKVAEATAERYLNEVLRTLDIRCLTFEVGRWIRQQHLHMGFIWRTLRSR
eukprot:2746601-Rhodomonas_salina.2